MASRGLGDRFLLRTSAGVLVPGGITAEFARLSQPGAFEQPALTWATVTGPNHPVSIDDAQRAMELAFDWRDLLERGARTLSLMRHTMEQGGLAAAPPSRMALEDTWPFSIDDADAVHRWFAARFPRSATMTPSGILALMAVALQTPWDVAVNRLHAVDSDRRFYRLAMISSDLACPPERGGPFATARIMLDVLRNEVFDCSIGRLVRAHEMYVELLCEELPEAAATFERATRVELRDWIFGLCALNAMIDGQLRAGQRPTPLIDLSGALPSTLAAPAQVAHSLAAPASWYREAFNERGVFAVSPFREQPILDLGGGRYLVLHDDFLLTAADEGVVARLRRFLPAAERQQLPNKLGYAFQIYVRRVLRRIFPAVDVADVPTTTGAQRCDFAVRVGDDLVLIDAKCMHLGTRVLDGEDGVECLVKPLQGGLEQVLATIEAIRCSGVASVVPGLSVPQDWRPRRCVGWLAVQPDLPMWFASATSLLDSDQRLSQEWRTCVAGRPLIVPVADLERLEAAGARYVVELVERMASDDALAYGGVPRLLSALGYSGPIVSEAIAEKHRQILAR